MSSLEESANRMQEIFPQSITITPILKRRGSEEQGEAKRRRGPGGEQQGGRQGDSGEGRQKAPGHLQLEPSWSLGCLYRCAICSVKFQTLSSFQSHLFFHRSTPEQYMALHGDPGVQFRHHACLRCGEMVQQVTSTSTSIPTSTSTSTFQDPLHLRLHLAGHGLSLQQYSSLLEVEGRGSSSGEAEVNTPFSHSPLNVPPVHLRHASFLFPSCSLSDPFLTPS